MATKKQQAHALISHFLKRYERLYGMKPPRFNRYALTYGFEALVEDYPAKAKDIIDFYFDSYESHDPVKFVYDYGKIAEWMREGEEDENSRAEIRRRTIERMKQKNVNDSRESDQGGNSQ